MSKKNSTEPKILLDCDVVIHFTKASRQLILPKVFRDRFVMLDKVHAELTKRNSAILPLSNFLTWCGIPVIEMPNNKEIFKEYAMLKKMMGDGEAACLAVAKHTKDYVASSNLSDIAKYCEEHNIIYLTTMDILLEAYKQGLLNETECDKFIFDVKNNGSKLIEKINRIKEYETLKNKSR